MTTLRERSLADTYVYPLSVVKTISFLIGQAEILVPPYYITFDISVAVVKYATCFAERTRVTKETLMKLSWPDHFKHFLCNLLKLCTMNLRICP